MPLGTFIRFEVVDGSRYDVFGRYGEDVADGIVGFDVYDEDGHRLNDVVLERPPSEIEIRLLARYSRSARTAWVAPRDDGWYFVAAGKDVILALPARWWPGP